MEDCLRRDNHVFAMQTNNNKFRGTLGEKVYFKLNGDYFARLRPDDVKVS